VSDESGRENWRYTLVKEAELGDIVFHYDKRPEKSAIVAYSIIDGAPILETVTWAARGTYARSKGVKAHPRDGFVIPLGSTTALAKPVTLAAMRARAAEIGQLVDDLLNEHGKRPLYFPFELSERRPLRLLQGYGFKLPRTFVDLFEELAVREQPGPQHNRDGVEDTPRRRGAPPPALNARRAIMQMRRAPAYTYLMEIRGASQPSFKIGWAFDYRLREREFNQHSIPHLGGLKYMTRLWKRWPTAIEAYRMEQELLRQFDDARHRANREVVCGISLEVLMAAWELFSASSGQMRFMNEAIDP
jgi:hypothetical protein